MSENPTFWQKTKTTSKAGFDKAWAGLDKLGAPVNRLSNKIGSESFWPKTLDKESEKAARILRSFCKDGFYAEEKEDELPAEGVPKGKQRVIKKIPTEVIRKAKGLAIFTTMRTGLWVSGAGGSGVVVARKEDGSWSEPSGIMLHTAGLGWLIGIDIYDCVLVLNTQKAVDAFTRLRWTLGGEVSAVAGPVGMGGVVDTELHKRQAPIFTYMKSRGFYAGVQVDGTVIIERNDENARFYRETISGTDILAGKVRNPPRELAMFKETLKAAQGDVVDEALLPTGPAPADHEVEESGHVFGVPDKEDPDPFGVRALEKEGLTINDAATHAPVPEETFAFNPSEKSPVYTTYHTRSASASLASPSSASRASLDAATQTGEPDPPGYEALPKPIVTKQSAPPSLPPRAPRLPVRPTVPSAEPAAEDAPIVMEDAEKEEPIKNTPVVEERDIAESKQFDQLDTSREPDFAKESPYGAEDETPIANRFSLPATIPSDSPAVENGESAEKFEEQRLSSDVSALRKSKDSLTADKDETSTEEFQDLSLSDTEKENVAKGQVKDESKGKEESDKADTMPGAFS